MPISCRMCDLGFYDFEAPASKGPASKPTHIEHFFSLAAHRRGRGRSGGGGTDGAKRKGRGGEGLSGRGGASLGSSGCGAVPSPCRGGATSRASGGRGGWCGTASLRGGLARRRAFEKVAKLASSGVLARCRAPRGRRHLSWLAPRGRRRLRLSASRGQRHLRCRVPHGRPRTPPS